ncbi:MAG: AlpA family phage regulatory protein [Azonexaceae bacterium]|nr:AlpA family phage regulatory protein [Azonexaceae bacterium]
MTNSNTQQTQLSLTLDDIVADLPALVREKQLRNDFVRIAHGTLWDWVAKNTFPAPVKLSSGVTAWRRSDLMAWASGSWTPA